MTDVEISIHSTTRVETVENVGDERKPIDFNPLHHEGGDGTAVKKYQYTTGFQSTPPRGWRRAYFLWDNWIIKISIHSTTRVETLSETSNLPDQCHFNPLHHEGGDDPQWPCSSVHHNFNPLHHEGGDPSRRIPCPSASKFQSTPPRGWRRRPLPLSLPPIPISIHSTTRVETAILHNNHYYSSTHFHKQIISHPLKSRPTIPAHSQIRSHCANFPVRISP